MKMRPVHAALLYFALVAGAVPILIPFLWMLSTALKTKEAANEFVAAAAGADDSQSKG